MISFKQVVKGIVVVILAVLSLSFFLNFVFIKQVEEELSSMNHQVQELNGMYIEMELPIRVFKNISQTISNDVTDESRKNKLAKAYGENRNKFINEINALHEKNNLLHKNITAYAGNLLIRNIVSFESLEKHSADLNRQITGLSKVAGDVLKPYLSISSEDTDRLDIAYKAMSKNFSSLSSIHNATLQTLIDKYITSISLLFCGLLICVLLLTLLIFRVFNKDLSYILQGFRMMSLHDYNEEKLPKMKTTFVEEVQVESLVTSVLREQKFLAEVKAVSSSGYIIDDILEDLFFSIQATLKTDRVGIAFVDYYNKKIIAEHGISNYGNLLLGPGFEVGFEETTLSKLLEDKHPLVNNDLEEEFRRRPHSVSLKQLMAEGIKSNIIFPLVMNESVFALLFFSSLKKDNYDEKCLQIGRNIALEISAILDKTYLTKTIFSKITNTFSDLVDKRDNETGGHIARMVQYSVTLAKALLTHKDKAYQADSRFVRDIQNNAAVHDIGKVGIPDKILKKPGKLSEEEWAVMKTHASIGGDIFAALKGSLKIFNRDFYKVSEDIARHHHERWDGTGYPAGLAGQDIPLSARIVAIADVFDALTSDRVYKKAYSFEKSVEIINQSAGSHLDPELVAVFSEKLDEFRDVYDREHPDGLSLAEPIPLLMRRGSR